MEAGKKITCICIVANRKLRNDITFALQEVGINLINTTYGKGLVNANFLQNILGLVPEENKVVFFCMTTITKAERALKILLDRFQFDQPNTGIAFTIPIEAVSH